MYLQCLYDLYLLYKVTTLVMDNDSTTISKVRSEVDQSISKKSDRNHTRKPFTGALFELNKIHKNLRNHKVRTHIERCFMYCIQQNKENADQLAKALDAIVPHLYGTVIFLYFGIIKILFLCPIMDVTYI